MSTFYYLIHAYYLCLSDVVRAPSAKWRLGKKKSMPLRIRLLFGLHGAKLKNQSTICFAASVKLDGCGSGRATLMQNKKESKIVF
jgi:hypothetical protein